MRVKKILFLILFTGICTVTFAQSAFRMKADIITRSKLADSTFQVSKGKLYYDQNYDKIVFDFSFPQKEIVVLYDTIMYYYREDTLFQKSPNILIPEQSIFNYILSGKISNFGLEQSHFRPSDIKKEDGKIITTWSAPDQLKEFLSAVVVITRKKLMYSATMLDPEGEVMNRQILKNYDIIQGINVPHEILIATKIGEGTMYQIINMDNVIINKLGEDELYDYEI